MDVRVDVERVGAVILRSAHRVGLESFHEYHPMGTSQTEWNDPEFPNSMEFPNIMEIPIIPTVFFFIIW